MVYQFYLLKELAFSLIDLCFLFLHFYFIYFCSGFYDFFTSTNCGRVFILLFLDAVDVRLGCLYDVFLISRGTIVLLSTSLLEVFCYIPEALGHHVFLSFASRYFFYFFLNLFSDLLVIWKCIK